MRTQLLICALLLALLATVAAQTNQPGFGSAKNVLILGLDGFGAYYFPNASHPNMNYLMGNGSSSLRGRGNTPSSSKINWAAILQGNGPVETGTVTNWWYTPENATLDKCFHYNSVDGGCLACGLCMQIVPIVARTPMSKVEADLDAVCEELSFLGMNVSADCKYLVNNYLMKIIELLLVVGDGQPFAICKIIELCIEFIPPSTPMESIYAFIKAAKPEIQTVMYTDHDVVLDLVEEDAIDFHMYRHEQSPLLVSDLVPIILQKKPQFVFFHFDNIDEAGHHYNWGSPQYYAAVALVDSLIGQLLDAYTQAGMIEDTLVLLTADHGGDPAENYHGVYDYYCVEVPWLAQGPGVQVNWTIPTYVKNTDIPATALWALGIPVPPAWHGRAVTELWTGKIPNPSPATPSSSINQIVVVVISGLMAGTVHNQSAETLPNLHKMMSQGSYTFAARSTFPSDDFSGLASLINGASPIEHGICQNFEGCYWSPFPGPQSLPPIATSKNGTLFPSIFALAAEQKPNLLTGAFYTSSNVSEILESVGYTNFAANDTQAVQNAANFIRTRKPAFTLVELQSVENAGLRYGFNTTRYNNAVIEVDGLLATIQQAVGPSTLLIVTSTNGGKDKTTTQYIPECLFVPLIANGPNVKADYILQDYIRTMDIASTAASLLGLEQPIYWKGTPITEMFN